MSKRYPRLPIGTRVVSWYIDMDDPNLTRTKDHYGVITGYDRQSPLVRYDGQTESRKVGPSNAHEVNDKNQVVRWLTGATS